MEELELLGELGVVGSSHVVDPKVTILLTEVAQSEERVGNLRLHSRAVNLMRGGTSLLVDPLDNSVLGPAARVVLPLAIPVTSSIRFMIDMLRV